MIKKLLIAILILLSTFYFTGCVETDPYPEDSFWSSIYPGSSNTSELGDISHIWSNIYADSIYVTSNTSIHFLDGSTIGGITTESDPVYTVNAPLTYIPYNGATGNINLNAKEVTNGTLNNMIGKGTWTTSGVWKLPAMFFNGDITTDRWLSNETNTFLGRSVAGVGNLAHTGGVEGYYNSGYGYQTLNGITIGAANSAFGNASLASLQDGNYNTAFGSGTLFDLISGNYNTACGVNAGHENLGSGNVFLGYKAGYDYIGNNALFIDNSDTATPLISGNFSSNELTINGRLYVTDNITLVTTSTIKWSDNSTAPVDTDLPVTWLPVKLPDGTTAYIPAYK